MKPFRSQTLKDLASQVPHCMHCKTPNHGQVVGAHWRSLSNGCGMGLKPPDLVAYLCNECHDLVDQRAGSLPKAERERIFFRAFWHSALWLFETGYVRVA